MHDSQNKQQATVTKTRELGSHERGVESERKMKISVSWFILLDCHTLLYVNMTGNVVPSHTPPHRWLAVVCSASFLGHLSSDELDDVALMGVVVKIIRFIPQRILGALEKLLDIVVLGTSS